MQTFEAPVITVTEFELVDIITTSTDHDNGFVDIGDLLKL